MLRSTLQAVLDHVQLARLEHSLELARPQALRILSLTEDLKRCDLVLVSLSKNRAYLIRPIWVHLLQLLFHPSRLHLGKSGASRADSYRRKLCAD